MASKLLDGRLVLIGGLALRALAAVAYAADPPAVDPPAADSKAADTSSDAKQDADTAVEDRYVVSEDGTVEQLLKFVDEVRAIRPETREEIAIHQRKALPATRKALTRMREMATDKDRSLDGFQDAMDLLLMIEVRSAQLSTPENMERAVGQLREALKDNPNPSEHLVTAARATASYYEINKQYERAAQLYSELGDILVKSENDTAVLMGKRLQGAARRLNLIGQPLQLSGTLMDGSAFDWDSYRGKVVLVDFWATWCGPCLREMPNVKSNYELYHDKGFEVVGVSLDNDRAALDAFLEKAPKPWANLYDGAWNDNKVATYYGVLGIPTVILVDKEGKVVSTYARGAELGRLLEQQLGPVDSKKDAEEKAADAATTEEKTSD